MSLMTCYQAFASKPMSILRLSWGGWFGDTGERDCWAKGRLDLYYYVISNSGPEARNHGAGKRLASICSYWILTWYYPPRGLTYLTR